ncbi:MAG: hypothetical protein AAGG00_13340 [Cyanobacteria bacterium P01_H01_bin.150]
MSNERKQRIMQHLKLTSNIRFQRFSRNLKSKVSKSVLTSFPVKLQPLAAKNRKQRIMGRFSYILKVVLIVLDAISSRIYATA